MLQITISAADLRLIRDWAEPAVVPIVLWAYHRSKLAAVKKLNEVITDNTNRNRDELISHIDGKFREHEGSAFGRIDTLDGRIGVLERNDFALSKSIDELRALKERNDTALARSVTELRELVVKYQLDIKSERDVLTIRDGKR